MLIESVHFKNFKSLRDTTLPLGRVTVLVGPNGSGKSSAIEGIFSIAAQSAMHGRSLLSAAADPSEQGDIRFELASEQRNPLNINNGTGEFSLPATTELPGIGFSSRDGHVIGAGIQVSNSLMSQIQASVVFSFEFDKLSAAETLTPNATMDGRGQNLVGELDRLRDKSPERFELLNQELHRWLPEFDRVLFDNPHASLREFKLRTTAGKRAIPARELSHGTLVALAFLTLAYRLEPPPLICFEEPDRGIHPRLYPNLQEAMYRLAYPASFGETRPPTQIIITTHSPYFLDLFKDHPEEIVVADKIGDSTTFKRLIDLPNAEAILDGSPLGEVWFSGILGGIPAA